MAVQRLADLVFTLFGEYLREREEPIWVGSLIALLEPPGMSESAVRTILSRMARRGWLRRRRVGRNSFYELTERGHRLLDEGARRIYNSTWDRPWDGSWLLLAYSIPEDQRSMRDRLRNRLTWLGFGSLGNGLWLSPHDVADEIGEVAEELGIGDNLEIFRARRVGGPEPEALVARCWDLSAINAHYREFVQRWQPKAAQLRDGLRSGEVAGRRCYVVRFELIHEYRAFPGEDPYLPRALLPPDWVGDRAAKLFNELHDELVGPADEYVEAILAQTPDE